MQVSWKWLNDIVDLKDWGSPAKLAELLTARGLEVEAMHAQSAGLEKVVTVKILERAKHPDSDRLSLCKVSLGSGEPLEIVCGAQNMKAGDTVALAQVGAELPNGMKIGLSKIRGVVSNGMLCSEVELGLAAESDGILILPESTQLGQPLAALLGRDDVIFSLKLTANRADCLSHYGLAREIASATGLPLKRPMADAFPKGECPIAISLDAGELAPQFLGIWMEGIKIGPSPAWLVARLEAVGARSINNVVDATNLVMFELGHPMHAYDGDKIVGKKIGVRVAKAGEKLPLLDGTTVELSGEELVITDAEKPVGLAGVMGGGNSEVSDATTRLFLECAEFAPSRVRRASSKHQKKTEASHRFERGIDPEGLELAITRLAKVISETAGGKVVGGKIVCPTKPTAAKITVAAAWISARLGLALTPARLQEIFEALGCRVEGKPDVWTVTPPSFRRDLRIPEDLVEEAARVEGYDRIPETLPTLTTPPASQLASPAAARLALMDVTKDALVGQGLREAMFFSFTSREVLSRVGLEPSVVVQNPISDECQAMSPSLLPSLIEGVLHANRHHFGSERPAHRLFALRPTFHATPEGVRADGQFKTGVDERWRLSWVLGGPRFKSGLRSELGEIGFADLKGSVEGLLASLGARGTRFVPLSQSRAPSPVSKLFHPGQSVELLAGKGVAGIFGAIHPLLAQKLKLREPLWLVELDWEALSAQCRSPFEAVGFKPWSEFPPMERDFALLVKSTVTAAEVVQSALKAGRPLAKTAKIFDIYRGSQVVEGMTSLAVRVTFYEETRSLQEAEVEKASLQMIEAFKKDLGAELR